jgi:MFS family permease
MSEAVTRKQAFIGLAVLTLINLLNYTDRYILAGVMQKVMGAFHLTDTQGGLLAFTFMIVYLTASPVGGYLGDRLPRHFLIGGAVLLWSLATIASGLAGTFLLLILARAATGIGEAGYGSIAPAFISDLFRPQERGQKLSIFYAAMPLGAGLGYVLGGVIGDEYGWQHAFYAGGVPGLVLGVVALGLREPARGGMDEGRSAPTPFKVGLHALFGNRRFWLVTSGLTLMTFSIGGLANWMPAFLERERGLTASHAGMLLGATTVVGGFAGTILGGILGDKLERRRAGGGVLLSGIGLILAAPMMLLAAVVESTPMLVACLLVAQILIFLNNGPLNAAIINAVSPNFRAFAFSISTLTLHLLGDAASPVIIGWLSDASSLARAIQLNAIPVLLGGLVLLWGQKFFSAAPQNTPMLK